MNTKLYTLYRYFEQATWSYLAAVHVLHSSFSIKEVYVVTVGEGTDEVWT